MNGEKGTIAAASALEILTGAALVVDPSLLARLLFGQGLDETGTMVGRTAGLVLVCLAIGCWPRPPAERSSTPLEPLLLMSVLVSVYLICLGITGLAYGLLLWPAVLTHLLITVFLARAWVKRRGRTMTGARR